MKKNIQILMDYFGKTYNLTRKTDKYQYVADELGVTTRTVWNAMIGKTNNKILDNLLKQVVNDFRKKGLIK